LLQELCQCFYQLKSFESELFDSSEKSDEDDVTDNDAEQMSSSEQDVVDQELNEEGSATDDKERQMPSAKPTRPHVSQDCLREKIRDMINVAHVSRYVNWKYSKKLLHFCLDHTVMKKLQTHQIMYGLR